MENVTEGKVLVLFDGVCVLCNGLVQRLIQLDKKDVFRFASLQSEFAVQLLNKFPVQSNLDSVVVVDEGKIFTEASAIFQMAKHLSWFHKTILVARVFPASFNNSIYRFVARKRYGWFGKFDACMIPTEEPKHKFIL